MTALGVLKRAGASRPTLPRVRVAQSPAELETICAAVEAAVVGLAGVSAEFAQGITAPLPRTVRGAIYPIAMYYFIIREAGLGHDGATAAANLLAAQTSGAFVQLKDLPGIDRDL